MAFETLARRDAASQMPHFLYRQFDAGGVLLYVGVTRNVKKRMTEHGSSHWKGRIHRVEVEEHPNREKALYAEKMAIMKERPEFNSIWKPSAPPVPGVTMTAAQRKAKERQAKREAGLVLVEFWVPKRLLSDVKDAVSEVVSE